MAQPEQEEIERAMLEVWQDVGDPRFPHIAQPEQEPVAWITKNGKGWLRWHRPEDNEKNKDSIPVYTTPPQRKPLSNQKIIEMYNEPRSDAEMIEFARAIEAAHGIWPENSDCYGPDWTDRDGEYLK